MFTAAFVSFASFVLLLTHLDQRYMRRIVGMKGWFDLLLHGTIIWMFFGTSTMGLLQAEAAGICFSLYLRFYHWAFGYEVFKSFKWRRFPGRFTR